MKCPKCGHEMRKGSTFCDRCGCRLPNDTTQNSQTNKKLMIAACCSVGFALIMIIIFVVLLMKSCNNQNTNANQPAVTVENTTVAQTTKKPATQPSTAQQSEQGRQETQDGESSSDGDQENGGSDNLDDDSAEGMDLSVYLETDVFDFPNHVPDVTKASATDGSNGWKNENLLVQTTPNQGIIDYIALHGESEYTIYGIKPGMSSEEAQSLAEAAGYTMTSEGEYSGDGKHMQIRYDGDNVKVITLTKSD